MKEDVIYLKHILWNIFVLNYLFHNIHSTTIIFIYNLIPLTQSVVCDF
jgi:hypothetical protein